MNTDKKQPPEGVDLMVVYVGNDGKECVTHGFFQRGFWWVGFQQQKLMYRFVEWFPMPTRDRLAILDRYDEERAEWERRVKHAEERDEQQERAGELSESSQTNFLSALDVDKKLTEALARADRAEKERDEARALCASIRDALSSVLDLDRSEPEVGLFPVTDKELPEVIKNREESLSRHLNELIAERDRAIAERDEAREAWGRAESDACEWEEKAGVASADLATFTEKLHKAEQERDDLGCQLEALRAIQRGDVADLRTRMEAVEGRIDTIVGIKMARNDDEKGGA